MLHNLTDGTNGLSRRDMLTAAAMSLGLLAWPSSENVDPSGWIRAGC